jgi:quinol monooxygenase YgiN|tara:strand:- start:88 stop:372 length:285 start_codon:yes stop_codon:yes gene_type:complete
MYGSIFKLNVKPGHQQDLLDSLTDGTPAGAVAWYVMQPDDTSKNLIGVAIFESKEAYQANSESPEQQERFMKAMTYLEAEPEWTDGEYIVAEVI